MANKKEVRMVVAIEKNGGFGYRNKMPWPRIHLDMKAFVANTSESTLVMGRKTLESLSPIELKSLFTKERKITVVSNTLKLGQVAPEISLAGNVEEAIEKASTPVISVIGGFGPYKEALEKNLVHVLYRTRIHRDFTCDVFFPKLGEEWKIEPGSKRLMDKESKIFISFDKLINTKNPH